jgi:uncharacterized protein (TIGR00369 family)
MANTQLSDRKRQEIKESFARQGFLAGLGARIAELSIGRCVLELPFGDAVSQQHDFFHGGALGALADMAGGYAAMTLAAEGIDVLTVEYKINFLRPAVGELASAVGQVLRSGLEAGSQSAAGRGSPRRASAGVAAWRPQ